MTQNLGLGGNRLGTSRLGAKLPDINRTLHSTCSVILKSSTTENDRGV